MEFHDKPNCVKEGQSGHQDCGICHDHQEPRTKCGCIAYPLEHDPGNPRQDEEEEG